MTLPRFDLGAVLIRELRIGSRRGSGHLLRLAVTSTAFLVLALTVLSAREGGLNGETGRGILRTIGCLGTFLFGFGACLSSSASIRSERRERTLGLLMLTPLRPTGVLLGKFCSISFQFLLCLLAIVPILSLPLFSGGTTPADVLRQVLNILTVLLLGSATGFLSSVLHREGKDSGTGALALLLSWFLIPVIAFFLPLMLLGGPDTPLEILIFSLSGPATLPFHSIINGWTPLSYSIHTGSILCLALLLLLLALRRFRILWKRRTHPGIGTGTVPVRDARSRSDRRQARLAFPDAGNPYFHLIRYPDRPRRLGRAVPWMGVILFLIVVVMESVLLEGHAFGWLLFFSTMLLEIATLVIYWHVCAQSSRRIGADRDAGVLESIVTTPLSIRGVTAGLRDALACSHTRLARALALCVLIQGVAVHILFHRLGWPHPLESIIGDIFVNLNTALLILLEIRAMRITGIAWGLGMKNRLKAAICLFMIFYVFPQSAIEVIWLLPAPPHPWLWYLVLCFLHLLPRLLIAWLLPRAADRKIRKLASGQPTGKRRGGPFR